MVFCTHLPVLKAPGDSHVPITLSSDLLAWRSDHPDVWRRYDEYAHNCTTTQQHEALFKYLEGWSATRSEEGQLDAVVDEYSGFFDKAEEGVKDMTTGVEKASG